MNPIGVSSWIWLSPFSDGTRRSLVARAQEAGAEVLEVAVEQIELVSRHGLRCRGTGQGNGPSRSAGLSAQPGTSQMNGRVRDAALTYIKQCIDLAHAVGAENVVGPCTRPSAKLDCSAPRPGERSVRRAVEGLRAAADYAAPAGVEPGHRASQSFRDRHGDTTEQGLELCDLVGRANVGLTLDTFHMNIEEKSPADAIRAAGDRLLHLQVCANDRGTPGTGHLPWPTSSARSATSVTEAK